MELTPGYQFEKRGELNLIVVSYFQNLENQCNKQNVHAPCAGQDTKDSERYMSCLVAAVHVAFVGWCQFRASSCVPAACMLALCSLPSSLHIMAPRGWPSDVYQRDEPKSGKPSAPRPPLPPQPPIRRPAAAFPKPPQPPPPRTLRADVRAWEAERAVMQTTRPKGVPAPPAVKATTSKASPSSEGLPLAPSIPITSAAKATTTTAPTLRPEPLFLVGTAMVTERELPLAHRINTLLRCPVSEFPDACPADIWRMISSNRWSWHGSKCTCAN